MQTIKEENWVGLYSLGDTNIDDDHVKLLKIYNNLVKMINNNGSRNDFAIVLIDMYDYSQSHFNREELYMIKLAYPQLEQHKAYHRKYLYKVSVFNSELLGNDPPSKFEVVEFLKRWWLNHIPNSDFKYEEYKRKIGSDLMY